MTGATISPGALALASVLVCVSLVFSATQKLGLERETLVAVVRAVVQLIAVGYVLQWIFDVDNPWFTAGLLLLMSGNAAWNAHRRGPEIPRGFPISLVAIVVGGGVTLAVLVATGAIGFAPNQMVPIGGMLLSNAMVALGLAYRRMADDFREQREVVETRLALGATPRAAAMPVIRTAIRTGMIPTIDSAKTLGIVALPGMMTGLILAGVSPLMAIRFQILVTFMLLATTAIATGIAAYLGYRGFFTARGQLAAPTPSARPRR